MHFFMAEVGLQIEIGGRKNSYCSTGFNISGIQPNSEDPHSGFIGLQCESGRVAFRNVRISAKPPRPVVETEVRVHLREVAHSAKPPKSEKVTR